MAKGNRIRQIEEHAWTSGFNAMHSHWSSKIPITEQKVIKPDSRIVDAFQKSGYSLEAAIADLIDNSIDARAKKVAVRFLRSNNELLALLVSDDGDGMSDSAIDRAMQFGGRRKYRPNDLGLYGLGLKSASLSLADEVTVLSRARGNRATGRRWVASSARAGWKCDVVDRNFCETELKAAMPRFVNFRSHGTMVRWDTVRDFHKAYGHVDAYLQKARRALSVHLGLQLHRFVEGKRPRLYIAIDTLNVETGENSAPSRIHPMDPFSYPQSGAKGYPKDFRLKLADAGVLIARAHIWPARTTLEGYKLGGGSVSRRQGFYFYRNDRLIQAGGWNNYQADDTEPHLSLARVSVDLTRNAENFFNVRFSKAGVDAPRSFVDALTGAKAKDGTSFDAFVKRAQEVYRRRPERALPPVFAPGRGIRAAVTDVVHKHRDVLPKHHLDFEWARLPPSRFFEIDRDTDRVLINLRYRHIMLVGRPASAADLPVVKTLLYLLVEELFHGERQSSLSKARLSGYQAALIAAVKEES